MRVRFAGGVIVDSESGLVLHLRGGKLGVNDAQSGEKLISDGSAGVALPERLAGSARPLVSLEALRLRDGGVVGQRIERSGDFVRRGQVMSLQKLQMV